MTHHGNGLLPHLQFQPRLLIQQTCSPTLIQILQTSKSVSFTPAKSMSPTAQPFGISLTQRKGFSMTSVAPFTLSYDSSMIHGYKHDICIKCDNPQMSATNSFSIQQESKCLPSYNNLNKREFILSPEETKNWEEIEAKQAEDAKDNEGNEENEDDEEKETRPTKYKYHYEHDFSSSEAPV